MVKSLRSISEGVASSIVYALLLTGGGVVLAILKAFVPNLFTLVLWGLVGAALMAVIVAAWAIWTRLPKRLPETTPENVEANIRAWLDAFRFSVKREQNEKATFEFMATPELAPPMTIGNYNELDRYVVIQSTVKFSDDDKKFFDTLHPDAQGALGAQLGVYLSRSRASFKMDLRKNEVIIHRRVPITSELTEYIFISAVEDFISTRLGAMNAMVLMLSAARKDHAASVVVPVPVPQTEQSDESR